MNTVRVFLQGRESTTKKLDGGHYISRDRVGQQKLKESVLK